MAGIRLRLTVLAPLIALSALSACSATGPVQPTGPASVVPGMVDAHNRVRAKALPRPQPPLPPLVWGRSAAEVARAYAAKCKFRHNSKRGAYGENLFAMSAHQAVAVVVPAAIRSWSSEGADYDLARNACKKSKICGHYTQMVWRDTRQVGCAIQHCDTGAPFGSGPWTLVVCNYDPPGNVVGRGPY
jgi:pathogenesis-related protein 1